MSIHVVVRDRELQTRKLNEKKRNEIKKRESKIETKSAYMNGIFDGLCVILFESTTDTRNEPQASVSCDEKSSTEKQNLTEQCEAT